MKVPMLAVHVTVVSPSGTPFARLTVPNGIPVLVSNADRKDFRTKLKSKYYQWSTIKRCLILLFEHDLLRVWNSVGLVNP